MLVGTGVGQGSCQAADKGHGNNRAGWCARGGGRLEHPHPRGWIHPEVRAGAAGDPVYQNSEKPLLIHFGIPLTP